MKSKVGSSLRIVKNESPKDPLSPALPPSTGFHPSSETGACGRMKSSTGSHSPSEDVKETPGCWLHLLTAAVPEYITTPGSSEQERELGSQHP